MTTECEELQEKCLTNKTHIAAVNETIGNAVSGRAATNKAKRIPK